MHAAVAPLHVILPSESLPPNVADLGTEPHRLVTSSVITWEAAWTTHYQLQLMYIIPDWASVHLIQYSSTFLTVTNYLTFACLDASKHANFTFEVEEHRWFSRLLVRLKGMGFKLVRGSIVLYLDDEPRLILCTSLGRVRRVVIIFDYIWSCTIEEGLGVSYIFVAFMALNGKLVTYFCGHSTIDFY